MIRAAAFVRLFGFLSLTAAAACASALIRDELQAIGYASTWQHGVKSIPDSVRLYMEANRAGTDAIEEILLGRRRAPPEFDKRIALYWLSDSGRPEYLRTLMRYAGDTNGTAATFAIYGLARHAGDPAVRARLLEVDATAPRDVRNNMAGVLTAVNDSGARSLLAVISRRDLRPDTIKRIERALRDPPLPAGKGRVPCLPYVPPPWTGPCPR